MAVAFDAVGPAGGAGANSSTSPLTWLHVNAGNAIVVGVTCFSGSTNNVTAVTYGGVALTFLSYVASGGVALGGVAFYGLVSGSLPTGSNTVSVSFSVADSHNGGSVSVSGAGSLGTPVTATAVTTTTVSATVPGTTTDGLIASVVCFGGGAGGGVFSATSPNVLRWSRNTTNSSASDNQAGGTDPSTGSGASQTVTWTNNAAADDWGIIAVEVLPPANRPAPRPATPPGFRSPMSFLPVVRTQGVPSSVLARISLGAIGTPATGTTALTVVIPSGAVAGQVAIMSVEACIATDVLASATATGWTQLTPAKDDGSSSPFPTITVLWRVLQAGDPGASVPLTFANTPDTCVGTINTYAGVDTTTPFEAQLSGFEAGAAAAPHTAGPITTTLDSDWIVTAFGDRQGSTWTPPAGFTERSDTATPSAVANLETADSNGPVAHGSITATASDSGGSSQVVWWIGALKVPSGAGVSNPLTLSGTVNVTGLLSNSLGKILLVTVNILGTLARSLGKILTGTVNVTGSLKASLGKILRGSVNVATTLATALIHALALSSTVKATGSLVNSIGKLLKATVSIAGTQKVSIGKISSGQVNVAGTQKISLSKIFSGQVNAVGTLAAIKTKLVTLLATVNIIAARKVGLGKIVSGTVNVAGSAVNQVGKKLTGTVNAAGSLVRSIGKALLATANVTGTLVQVKTKLVTLAAAVNVTGAAKVSIGKIMAAVVNVAPAVTSQVGKKLAAAVQVPSSLVRSTGKLLAGTVNIAGTLATVKVKLLSLAAVVNAGGTVRVSLGKVIPATVQVAGTVTSRVGKIMAATVNATGRAASSVGKILSGQVKITSAITVLRVRLLTLTATVLVTAAQKVSIGKAVPATVQVTGAVTRSIARKIATTVQAAGSVVRARAVVLGTTVRMAGSLVAAVSQPVGLILFKLGTVTKRWITGGIKKNWRVP